MCEPYWSATSKKQTPRSSAWRTTRVNSLTPSRVWLLAWPEPIAAGPHADERDLDARLAQRDLVGRALGQARPRGGGAAVRGRDGGGQGGGRRRSPGRGSRGGSGAASWRRSPGGFGGRSGLRSRSRSDRALAEIRNRRRRFYPRPRRATIAPGSYASRGDAPGRELATRRERCMFTGLVEALGRVERGGRGGCRGAADARLAGPGRRRRWRSARAWRSTAAA